MACCWSGTRSGRTIAISQEAFTDSTLARFNLLTKSLLRTCPVESHYTGLEEGSRGLPSRVRYARYDLLRTHFTTTS